MSRVDWICLVAGLRPVKCVVPFRRYLITSRRVDNFSRDLDKRIWPAVADNSIGGHVGYWSISLLEDLWHLTSCNIPIVIRRSYANELPWRLAIHIQLLEDGMCKNARINEV
jgi:hypothetical protein